MNFNKFKNTFGVFYEKHLCLWEKIEEEQKDNNQLKAETVDESGEEKFVQHEF